MVVPGGAFGATKGLYDRFGPKRVRDTPISELAIAGAGVGAALTGSRPVVEITATGSSRFDEFQREFAK